MGTRLALQTKLEEVLGSDHVYFQPPSSVRMKYPAIVYSRTSGDTTFADNIPYRFMHRYQITLIDPDPDSEILDRIAQLPYCVMDRHYVADNLNHDSFQLYY